MNQETNIITNIIKETIKKTAPKNKHHHILALSNIIYYYGQNGETSIAINNHNITITWFTNQQRHNPTTQQHTQ